jgi:cytosine/adenosine deaminase-related metal-dependent hydrolase
MTERILIRGGHVISMDTEIGDQPRTDILIENDKIAAIGPDIGIGLEELADTHIVNAAGRIVIPGFVDTHRHTWEACIRGVAPDATLDDYFVDILDTYAPHYRPEDVYAGNLAGSLECLSAGITTLVDWSHINNTPEHSDAALQALNEAGIRAQYAYGSANTSLADYWFDSKIAIPAHDVNRIRSTYFAASRGVSASGLLTMALATRGPGFCQPEVVRTEWRIAAELDLPITVHVAMGRLAGRYAMVKQLSDMRLLRERTTYVHCCYLSDEEWRMVAGSGGTVSIAAQVELQMGHGWPPVMKAIEHGLEPALSTDVVTTVPGDPFTQMRAAFASERARVNAQCWETDTPVPENMLTARDMLTMATINGAKLAGLSEKTGSLTPGKQADIVVIDATAVNVAPVIDPVAAVVLSADPSNVETVIVGGVIHKLDGRVLGDTTRARALVENSRDHLLRAAASAAASKNLVRACGAHATPHRVLYTLVC